MPEQRVIPAGKPTLAGNELAYVTDCLRRVQLSNDIYVRTFEEQFAAYIGVEHAVAVMNGTAALHLALAAWNIGPGDEVIVPALTFVATANAVRYTGATPVIVDVQPDTWCIDPTSAAEAITPRTRAIIAVDLYGAPADMITLQVLSASKGLLLLDDAAEALGALIGNQLVGSRGDATCFSFYGNKTLATGEGGMVVTAVNETARRLRLLRGQGQALRRYWHQELGFNYRMTELQAAVGCAQLESLDDFIRERRRVLALYRQWLSSLQFQKVGYGDAHGAWATAVLLPDGVDRDDVIEKMAARGVGTRPVFYPLNQLPMYLHYGNPVAAQIARRGLVLPTYPSLTEDDVAYVCETLEAVLNA